MTTFMDRFIGEGQGLAISHNLRAPDLSGSKVTDCDGNPALVEVTVSIGEFDPGEIVLGVTTRDDGYVLVSLDFTAAHRLMCALQDGLAIHATQPDDEEEIEPDDDEDEDDEDWASWSFLVTGEDDGKEDEDVTAELTTA
jgi:hypothetical protein